MVGFLCISRERREDFGGLDWATYACEGAMAVASVIPRNKEKSHMDTVTHFNVCGMTVNAGTVESNIVVLLVSTGVVN